MRRPVRGLLQTFVRISRKTSAILDGHGHDLRVPARDHGHRGGLLPASALPPNRLAPAPAGWHGRRLLVGRDTHSSDLHARQLTSMSSDEAGTPGLPTIGAAD